MTVLGVPPDEAGDKLVVVRSALPDAELVPAPLPTDICFYREFPQVPLTDLPQLAGAVRDSYLQMGSAHPPCLRRCPLDSARPRQLTPDPSRRPSPVQPDASQLPTQVRHAEHGQRSYFVGHCHQVALRREREVPGRLPAERLPAES